MAEFIEIYDLEGNYLRDEERKSFYKQLKEQYDKEGKTDTSTKGIYLFLIDRGGNIYLQKRSKIVLQNPSLWDKTVGGHVMKGDSFEDTLVRETKEEINVDVILTTSDDFEETVKSTDLTKKAVVKRIDTLQRESRRVLAGGKYFIKHTNSAMFFGYYEGDFKLIDGEVEEMKLFSLDELEKSLNKNPEQFTDDVVFLIKKYKKFFIPLVVSHTSHVKQ
tara:strand:+ start:380 stop:1036 length:657 start_codon:yes stop_codon:yes gene_type:complete